jgi:hypothetical protein
MAFHKHGFFSFSIAVQRMCVVGGNNFVADITALRFHGPSGAALVLEVPAIPEQYGQTAREAEGRAAEFMANWLNKHPAASAQPGPSPNSA